MKFQFTVFSFLLAFSFSANAFEQRCSNGNAFGQWQCFQKVLDKTEENITHQINLIHELYASDAKNTELIYKLDISQLAWTTYRDAFCTRNHRRMDPIHSPSLNLEITLCRLKISEARLSELKDNYKF